MKIPRLLLFLTLLNLLACSSDSSEPDFPSDDPDQETPDTVAPEIKVVGLDAIVERKTILDISIIDDSTVETKIFVNDQEVLASMNKQFEYELNPYNIAVGNISLRVVSEDIEGNTSDSQFSTEIKHLLMEFNLGADEMYEIDNAWAFFNNAAGELLNTKNLNIGNNKIYTDALIPEDHIYYTFTKYITYGQNVVHTLSNDSYKISPGETRNEFDRLIVDTDNELEIEIIREELVNEWSKFQTQGAKYGKISFFGTSEPSFSEIFSIKYANPEVIYIRTAVENAGNRFDGKKENYLYTTIQPEPVMANMQVAEADFNTMDDHWVQDIPLHDFSTLSFVRYGFENEEDVVENIYHNIYEVVEDQSTLSDVDLPILEGLPYYNNIVRYQKDGARVYVRQFGNTLNLEAPNWILASYGINGSDYYVQADNADVDYYLLRLSKNSGTSGPSKSFVWVFRTFGNQEGDQTTPQLAFPEEITNSIGDPFYDSSDLTPQYAVAADFDEINSFEEAMDYLATRKKALKTNEQNIKSLRFNQLPTIGRSIGNPDLKNDSLGPDF